MRYINYLFTILIVFTSQYLIFLSGNPIFLNILIGLVIMAVSSMCISLISIFIMRETFTNTSPYILGFLEKKTFFEYKNKNYFTIVDGYNVIIWKEYFHIYISVGKFSDSDDKVTYQSRLTYTIDKYEKDKLDSKLKKRFQKSKYRDFNQV